MSSWLTAILLLIAFVIVTTLVYKTTIVLYDKKIAEIDALKEKCAQEVVEKKNAYEAIRTLMYAEINALLKKANTAGFTTNEDREEYAALDAVYRNLGGNHDSKEKRERFYSLPYFEEARREHKELVYRQMVNNDEWIFDNDIDDILLPNSVANERRMKTKTDKGVAQP